MPIDSGRALFLQDPIFNGTDGSYKGTQLFTCPPNCGLFISVDYITLL